MVLGKMLMYNSGKFSKGQYLKYVLLHIGDDALGEAQLRIQQLTKCPNKSECEVTVYLKMVVRTYFYKTEVTIFLYFKQRRKIDSEISHLLTLKTARQLAAVQNCSII